MKHMADLKNLKEASKWASDYMKKKVSVSNISYLVSYGQIKKQGENGNLLVDIEELKLYYDTHIISKEERWKDELGKDLNWDLSFTQYKEAETTKHVHRLHPYKGKFIPQLVEYFLDSHTDNFKRETYFNKGDIVLDPFSGSGTTLVQANELEIHSVGIDISAFNSLIGNIKIRKHDLVKLAVIINEITNKLGGFISENNIAEVDEQLLKRLYSFNNEFFPAPDFRYKVKNRLINEKAYAIEKEKIFLEQYNKVIADFNIKLTQDDQSTFLNKWFLAPVRLEIEYVKKLIYEETDIDLRNVLKIILSRTIRSCRATTHSDLATIKEPIITSYYCTKHYKICKPILSIIKMWMKYSQDTIERFIEFDNHRTQTFQYCLTADSTTVDIFSKLAEDHPEFGKIIKEKKIKGIFSSPPYVGLIDYHEQHAYSYELFEEFERNDSLEIGRMSNGSGKKAQNDYVDGISKVLINSRKYMVDDFNVFLVANDKYNLYDEIAAKSNMVIVNRFERPVLNRTERNKDAYAETIFHLKHSIGSFLT